LVMFPNWLVFFMKQLIRSKATLLWITLLTVAAAISGVAAPILIGKLIDTITYHSGEGMIPISVFLLGSILLAECCIAVRTYVSEKTMLRHAYTLTEETLAAVLRTSFEFFTKTSRGELIQRCTQDTK